MDKVLSVVICTHNRSGWLATALETLACQSSPAENYEILVVDNHSADETKRVVQSFAAKLANLRYVYEPEIGLSAARNRGWREARGEYVGYLDDDAKAPPEWVSVALEVATCVAPEAFGGPYYAFYDSPKPAWFKDEYGSAVRGNEPRPLDSNEYLIGNNFCVRRDILVELKGFNPALGMKGKKIAYGEETRLIIDLRGKYPGAIIYYEPRLFIYHLVRAEKMDLWRLPIRFFIDGQYACRTLSPAIRGGALVTIGKIAFTLLRLLKSCTWNLVRRDKKEYPYYQSFLYKRSFRYLSHLGWSLETLSRTVRGN